MTSLQSSDQALKIDTLARVRTSRERRRELLDGFERSGLRGSKFAALAPVANVPTVAAPKAQPAKPSHSESKPRLPENLPVIEEVIDPEAVKAQPGAWRCIGQEVSEQLDYEPGRFLRRRAIRRKYVHKQDRDCPPLVAALPDCLQERVLDSNCLAIRHMPLYEERDP